MFQKVVNYKKSQSFIAQNIGVCVALMVLSLTGVLPATAQVVHKCKGANGTTVFSSVPCEIDASGKAQGEVKRYQNGKEVPVDIWAATKPTEKSVNDLARAPMPPVKPSEKWAHDLAKDYLKYQNLKGKKDLSRGELMHQDNLDIFIFKTCEQSTLEERSKDKYVVCLYLKQMQ